MALLPPFYLDAVVSISVANPNGEHVPVGTGFIYADKILEQDNEYRLWVVTNKHVIKDKEEIFLKFNSLEGTDSKNYRVDISENNKKLTLARHPEEDVDVAAFFINAGFLEDEKRNYNVIKSDAHVTDRNGLKELGVTEGDRVFVLGYPMGLVHKLKQYTICRIGAFARVRDFIEGFSKGFLIDCWVFPGNSGGPVILCPSALAIQGTKSIPNANLIGIVKSYVSYTDIAVSQQTGKPRVIFEENSGLTLVDSVDSIKATIAIGTKMLEIINKSGV